MKLQMPSSLDNSNILWTLLAGMKTICRTAVAAASTGANKFRRHMQMAPMLSNFAQRPESPRAPAHLELGWIFHHMNRIWWKHFRIKLKSQKLYWFFFIRIVKFKKCQNQTFYVKFQCEKSSESPDFFSFEDIFL